jgi:hypothetical protein
MIASEFDGEIWISFGQPGLESLRISSTRNIEGSGNQKIKNRAGWPARSDSDESAHLPTKEGMNIAGAP